MKRILAALITLVLAFSLAGCFFTPKPSTDNRSPEPVTPSSTPDGSTAKPSEEASLPGTWKATVDMANIYNQVFAEAAKDETSGIPAGFTIDEFKIKFIMTFNEDGTATLNVDEAMLTTAVDNMANKITNALLVDLEKTCQEEYGMTLKEILEESGQSYEDMVDAYKSTMKSSLQATVNAESMASESQYCLEGDKLYMDETDINDAMAHDRYYTIALTADTLKFVSISDAMLEEESADSTTDDVSMFNELFNNMIFTK